MADIATAVENLCAALGTKDDPEMAELLAAFSRCSRTCDDASAALLRGDLEEGRRQIARAKELRERLSVLAAAIQHKLSGSASH